ncbi:MAG: hypothetical protein ACREMJ_07990, partial [Gemmatimonadales bacterium]
ALLRATRPEGLLERDQPRAAVAAEGLRALIPSLSGPQAGPIIPNELYTKVYVWDEAAGHYVEDPGQTGPATGVRFVLYAIDPFTEQPASPLNPVGYADLLDESAGNTLQLHLLVKNTAGTVTYVDYTAAVTPGTGSFGATVSGYLANGQAGAARRLDFDIAFSASETQTGADISADATFDLANSSVSFEIHDDAHFAGNTWTFTRDFRFHRPGEVVTVQGEIVITETAPETFTINGQIDVRINGGLFVRITITNGEVTVNRELSEQEQLVMLHLLEALDDVWDSIEDFFDPLDLFVG